VRNEDYNELARKRIQGDPMTFKYHDNKNGGQVILTVDNLDLITDADKIFEKEFGYNPVKAPWIGCECIPGSGLPKIFGDKF